MITLNTKAMLDFNELKSKQQKELREKMVDIINENYEIYKVGDIIEDHIGYGRVNEIHYEISGFGYPNFDIVYVCDNLTRKKEINKREATRNIYMSNIKQ